MKYLHTMLRVRDLEQALDFFVNKLGLQEIRRSDYEKGRFSLVFLGPAPDQPVIELTWNWDQTEPYSLGRFFGHVAFQVDDIYATCARLEAQGVTIHRPPRDGYMAFIKSPDGHSVELLQAGNPRPPAEPWLSMPNTGEW
ncbi:lactoylglutathione lyase [bacterium (Candidatus Blackallbacteria) CG17_big_fil_post_rev_8_21_14_2_50_48_46]|uniref:Lactoylglutathione lyase n=1 Tax=bacterium (Candidatus Blackallbacteria) CG17_big_fil_post_rev_8_21_14_2_50_48_46 TaxID=2014261 RepID=A0A2M7G157_9BACT|nr:MAG: lactoylglutathione lyase [bacterium (Candidatus Blackallbacteria) CG18_big_fil_WC_8_21_14_2_50_49_26]PIW15435.1 MAG: lactoylglutathione lyase [bacterium (Candidatus Blackallbacteria) CG17_big_fil_post_rev_8_21_14_2_50_48_46]PIW49704.1 MAG: lactoylglutathione lyase [bacterium (Candidatus Blackallbacteria) CG13_big_fil_rev_8_21_14_2_50_49_14]